MAAVFGPVGGVHLPPLGVEVAVDAERVRVVTCVLEERIHGVVARNLVHVSDLEEPGAEDERGQEENEPGAEGKARITGEVAGACRGRGRILPVDDRFGRCGISIHG